MKINSKTFSLSANEYLTPPPLSPLPPPRSVVTYQDAVLFPFVFHTISCQSFSHLVLIQLSILDWQVVF